MSMRATRTHGYTDTRGRWRCYAAPMDWTDWLSNRGPLRTGNAALVLFAMALVAEATRRWWEERH